MNMDNKNNYVSNMNYAIKLLQNEREIIKNDLKSGDSDRLKELQEIDKALGWLTLLQNNNVDKASRYDLDELPCIKGHGGFSSYRIAIDNEEDNPEYWQEYQRVDGSHYLLNIGDFVLVHKI